MSERRLNARYHEVESSLGIMEERMATLNTNAMEVSSGQVECTQLELLPFEERAISSTMWSIFETERIPGGENAIVSRRSSDALAVTARVVLEIEHGGSITIDSHNVLKRFVTPNGVAFLTESCSEWKRNSPGDSTWSHATREGGCLCCEITSTKALACVKLEL
ncbi:unnamed protein product [Phytophthora lilii]|uniref:Unnamed protein product n=1 Tax=Phytophthora lilii TaxID=2077276 RepID=A0A9W6U1Y4_9STRA|nr:unnamed protein product [Phytophthora lilii]